MSADVTAKPVNNSLEGEYAGFATRMVAFIIDITIINLSALVVSALTWLVFDFFSSALSFSFSQPFIDLSTISTWVTAAITFITLMAMIWLYPTVLWIINGQTIGKRIMGLRVVRMDGKRMTLLKGFVRVLGYLIGAIPIFLGFIWILFSNERRGWHDLLAGTCVIYSWEARGSDVLKANVLRTRQHLVNEHNEATQRTTS